MKARSLRYPIRKPLIAPRSAPNDNGGGSDRNDRPAQNVERIERAEIRQREHRSDRKVDAADDYDETLAERDEADLARLTGGVRQARG